MRFPTAWIDKIFDRLSIRYGRDFLGRWEGMPIAAVKTDWCSVLEGMAGHPEAISWALENLPDSKPPTAQDFRALCRRAPMPSLAQLPAPMPDPDRVAAEMARLAPIRVTGQVLVDDGKDWARRLLSRERDGERLSPSQIRFAREALRRAA